MYIYICVVLSGMWIFARLNFICSCDLAIFEMNFSVMSFQYWLLFDLYLLKRLKFVSLGGYVCYLEGAICNLCIAAL